METTVILSLIVIGVDWPPTSLVMYGYTVKIRTKLVELDVK